MSLAICDFERVSLTDVNFEADFQFLMKPSTFPCASKDMKDVEPGPSTRYRPTIRATGTYARPAVVGEGPACGVTSDPSSGNAAFSTKWVESLGMARFRRRCSERGWTPA